MKNTNIFDLSLLQPLYLSDNKKIIKLNNYIRDPKKTSRYFYVSNYSNLNIAGIRLFLHNNNILNSTPSFKSKSINLYSLINYYSFFFRNCVIFLQKNSSLKKFRGILVSLLRGGYLLLKYFSRKYDQSFTSIFMPDLFTNDDQFKLTQYYEYGNHFRFSIISEPQFCWFFHNYTIKDDLLFHHLSKSKFLMFSFTSDNKIIEQSDFFFPYNVIDDRSLYGGIVIMGLLFHDIFFFINKKKQMNYKTKQGRRYRKRKKLLKKGTKN